MENLKWFGVWTIYEHFGLRSKDRLYEERIVLIQAASQSEALAKAEREAAAYASKDTRYLAFVSAYEMFEAPGESIEVFSLMRESDLDPKHYIDRFFDTGRERTSSE